MPSMLSSSRTSRIEALRDKHAALSNQVQAAQNSPGTADFYLTQLKKQKLAIKEEIEAVRAARKKHVA